MLIEATPKGFTRYRHNRDTALPRLVERMTLIYGLSGVTTSIGPRVGNSCTLTQDGIHITLNPGSIEELAQRKWIGTTEELPLAIADLMVVTHEVNHAVDFKDPTFFIELDDKSFKRRKARRFFTTCVDEIVIDKRITSIPLLKRYFKAFNTRLINHDMVGMPQHIQFIYAIRNLVLEEDPIILVADDVSALLDELIKTEEGGLANLASIFDPELSFKERHRLSDDLLYEQYIELLRRDLAQADLYTIGKVYEDLGFLSALVGLDPSDLETVDETEMREYQDELFRVTEEYVDEKTLESIKEAENLSDGEDDGSPGLILPRRGEAVDELELSAHSIVEYQNATRRWHGVIEEVSDLLLKLASPKESITVPRYRHLAAIDGARLNPSALIGAYIQLISETPQPIWQPIEKRVRHQDLQFSGLDVYLLLDVSGSMAGENAEYASAMSVCLIEGLQLARHRAETDPKQGSVDVRTQLLAFGAGWAELTPLCKAPTIVQKETAYYNLLHPSSNLTMINGALKHVKQNALVYPERNIVCLIVSDGLFSDNLQAFNTVQSMPPTVYVGHISIGDSAGIPITLHHETVYDPKVLPKKLYSILEEYFKDVGPKSVLS